MAALSPRRIVSLEPSITAMLAALDQQARLVAVSEWCSRLVDVGDLPRLPSTWSANTDAIVAHRPDLVIASVPYRAETITALLQAGLNVLCLYPQSLADVYRHLAWLGHLLGVPDRAEAVIDKLRLDFEAIRQRAKKRPRPRVYVEMWPKPPMSSPTWVAELVEIAGGRFVPAKPGRATTDEEIQEADPEIIVVAWAGVAQPKVEHVLQRPGWDSLTAIRTGRVVMMDEIYLNAPGPNLLEGAKQLAKAIHPELFGTVS